jgi:hypothetical protein
MRLDLVAIRTDQLPECGLVPDRAWSISSALTRPSSRHLTLLKCVSLPHSTDTGDSSIWALLAAQFDDHAAPVPVSPGWPGSKASHASRQLPDIDVARITAPTEAYRCSA